MATSVIDGDEVPGKINKTMIMKALDYGYDKAVNGLPGMGTAYELAQDYLKDDGTLKKQATELVNWQVAKAGTSGFITGLGGVITLPVAIPANIVSVLYFQIRMIAAVAVMGGYDIRTDKVKALVYICLCGSAAVDVIKDVGIKTGSMMARNAIKKVSAETIKKINGYVGGRLVTRFGQTGIVNLGKAVPLIGGLIGGTIDAVSTKAIGEFAISKFIHPKPQRARRTKKGV